MLESRLMAYLDVGGFPEVQSLDRSMRIRVLQSYLDVVILRDIVERHRVAGVVALRHMIRHLIGHPACMFTVNRFHGDLRSRQIPVGKDTLHEYLDHLCDAYLFFPVYIHTHSERVRQVNPRKMYAIDTGLVRACSLSPEADTGHLLENLVFLELRRRGRSMEYYRTDSGKEVDFLVTDPDEGVTLVQVCSDPTSRGTREREIGALAEAMSELGHESATLVTLVDSESVDVDAGTIRIVPASRWALGLDGEQ